MCSLALIVTGGPDRASVMSFTERPIERDRLHVAKVEYLAQEARNVIVIHGSARTGQ